MRWLIRSILGVPGLILLLLAGGCGTPANETSPGGVRPAARTFTGGYPIAVVCTTGMVADIVQNVGGRQVRVTHLMGEGVDPHLYKASPGDISQLNAADIIFYSGQHLEGKMGDIFVRLARKKPTFAVTETISEEKILEVNGGVHDPHLWFDASLWSDAAGVVRAALAEYDPPHAADYQTATKAYQEELAALHEECRRRIATIPRERRVLVTAHDAFQYFGRAYDIEVKAIQGISTESEAGVREINNLVDFIVRREVRAVFVESSVSDRNIKALVEGCRARGHDVAIGGQLFSDAMGKAGTPQGTYVGMVRANVDTITKALQ